MLLSMVGPYPKDAEMKSEAIVTQSVG